MFEMAYKNGYAMDRCIGAIDALSHLDEKGGGLVYQFGRKDPFIETAYSIWTYDEYGNPKKNSDTKIYPASMTKVMTILVA